MVLEDFFLLEVGRVKIVCHLGRENGQAGALSQNPLYEDQERNIWS